jgi:hypothetical protein
MSTLVTMVNKINAAIEEALNASGPMMVTEVDVMEVLVEESLRWNPGWLILRT